jgi:2'-5' RNA ligase
LLNHRYTRHRRSARNTYDGYYIGTNFGSLLFDKDSLEVSVRALPDGHAVLHRTIYPERIHVDSEHGPGLLIRPRDFFRFHRDGSTMLRIMAYAVLQYLVYKWLKWAIHGVRIRLCPKWGEKDDDDGDGEGDSDGDEEGRGKNKRKKKLRTCAKTAQPTGSITRRDPLDLANTTGGDSEEEEEVANLPNDPEGEFQYWKRRFYEGKDTPNEVSEVLERTTSDRGVITTKKMTVSDPKKKTMNVEYIFEIPEELNVETSQPGVPPSSSSMSTSTSASHTSYAAKGGRNPPVVAMKARRVESSGDDYDDSEVEKEDDGGKESLLPESMRMFFAVSLPESVKSVIEESTRSARNTDDNTGDVPMKWSSKNGYHVTVRFIGEVKRADLPAMVKRLQEELSKLPFSCFDMALKGCGSFPHGGRPRILWAGLDDACVPFLKALRSAADVAISGLDSFKHGAEGEKEEEMNVHVTVARCNANRNDPSKTPAAAAYFLAENAQFQTPAWSVASLDLYLSESSSTPSSSSSSSSAVEEYAGRAGSVYTMYRSFPLP